MREALENRKIDQRQNLSLIGKTVLQMKHVEGMVQIRKFEGIEASCVLSKELMLSKQMFNHHMPEGYNYLFSIETDVETDLNVFNHIL